MAMIIITSSSSLALKSSTILALGVTLLRSTPVLSTMMSITFSLISGKGGRSGAALVREPNDNVIARQAKQDQDHEG